MSCPTSWPVADHPLLRRLVRTELRYAANELTGHKLYRPFQTLETLPMYEEMIVTGAWWDYVAAIATTGWGPCCGLTRGLRSASRRTTSPRCWPEDDEARHGSLRP